MSQEQLQEASGIHQSRISAIETRKVIDPQGETLVRLAKALKVSVAYLATGEDVSDMGSTWVGEDLAKRYSLDELLLAVSIAAGKDKRGGQTKTDTG